jgi:adenylate cyclase
MARAAGAAGAGQLPADRAALVAAGPIDRTVGAIREMFQGDPGLAARMMRARPAPPRPRPDLVDALIDMYAGPESRYLDFYGPARTITTVPYADVVAPAGDALPPDRVAGKAIFVGLSEQLRPEQKDGFNTIFSQATGVDIGGVEIAATAFGNFLEGRHVQPWRPPSARGRPAVPPAGPTCAAAR